MHSVAVKHEMRNSFRPFTVVTNELSFLGAAAPALTTGEDATDGEAPASGGGCDVDPETAECGECEDKECTCAVDSSSPLPGPARIC
jgi:hypothetical protein